MMSVSALSVKLSLYLHRLVLWYLEVTLGRLESILRYIFPYEFLSLLHARCHRRENIWSSRLSFSSLVNNTFSSQMVISMCIVGLPTCPSPQISVCTGAASVSMERRRTYGWTMDPSCCRVALRLIFIVYTPCSESASRRKTPRTSRRRVPRRMSNDPATRFSLFGLDHKHICILCNSGRLLSLGCCQVLLRGRLCSRFRARVALMKD